MSEAVIALIGALIGGVLTGAVTMLVEAARRKDAVHESRERDRRSLKQAARLIQLELLNAEGELKVQSDPHGFAAGLDLPTDRWDQFAPALAESDDVTWKAWGEISLAYIVMRDALRLARSRGDASVAEAQHDDEPDPSGTPSSSAPNEGESATGVESSATSASSTPDEPASRDDSEPAAEALRDRAEQPNKGESATDFATRIVGAGADAANAIVEGLEAKESSGVVREPGLWERIRWFAFAGLVGLVLGVAGVWLVSEAMPANRPSVRDAEIRAITETKRREQRTVTEPVDILASICRRVGDEYRCTLAVSEPRPWGGEAAIVLAIYDDETLVVRSYEGPGQRPDR